LILRLKQLQIQRAEAQVTLLRWTQMLEDHEKRLAMGEALFQVSNIMLGKCLTAVGLSFLFSAVPSKHLSPSIPICCY
jgi:hypothetical protein